MQSSGATVDEPVLAGLASGVRDVGPNPFAPWQAGAASATIRLRISGAGANQPARLDVVDLNGRLVRNLVNAPLGSGLHLQSWDGRDAAGQPVGAGIYYVRFSNGEGTNGARLVVLH
jgi:flagellar hook assembly protein FlgD